MDLAGARSLMLYFAAVLVATGLYTLWRLRAAPAVPNEEKASFVLMGSGSQAVLQMDPRSLAETGAPAETGAHPAEEGASVADDNPRRPD